MSEASVSDPSERLINLFGALALGVADRVKIAALDDMELSGETAAALVVIGHAPGLSIDQLGRVLRLSHPGTVRLVDRLEKAKLAARKPGEKDRRVVSLRLTATGRVERKALLNRRRTAMATILNNVAHADRETLERIAESLLTTLPQDAVTALAVCRFCNEKECEDCPMDVFGTLE